MNALQRVATSILVVATFPVAGAGVEAAAAARRTPFTHFGAGTVLPLRGDGAVATIEFGSRADELVKRATLHFRYTHSPALAPGVSHIRLTLNDVAIGVLPISPEGAGKSVAHEVDIDPRLIVGFNRLVMTLAAVPASGPTDAARTDLWAEASGASELEIGVQTLTVADDLEILPEPFFDRRDQRRVTIPFVFAAQPSAATLRAAAVVASWFGQHAQWRGARFPVHLDGPAPGHSVAFVPNGERLAFLEALPPATGPQLRIMTNPADGRSKLLLVLGRDGDDLKAAADALALGGVAMTGPVVNVKRVEDKGARAAYDAPRFVRLDRAMKLGELIDGPQQLQASGRAPQLDPIRVDVRMPSDLATWRGPGVPLTLELQYTPPACATDSYLDLGLDDEVFQVVALRSAQQA
ncbi:MAG: cellulose biosynthesis cyclic di-GMP-binding regulatory protein BcsB, partial [Usitatibacter sp.]